MESSQKSIQKLRRLWITALASIAVLTVFGLIVAQFLVQQQIDDAHTINLSGRQRMLSQRMTKCVLAIERSHHSADTSVIPFFYEELIESFDSWKKVHYGLQYGSSDFNLPSRQNSAEITVLFAKITPFYQAIDSAIAKIIQLQATDGNNIIAEEKRQIFQHYISILLFNQKHFLESMDEITFQFDTESTKRTFGIRTTLQALLVITLIVIFMEGMYILQPALRQLDSIIQELVQSRQLYRSLSEYVIDGSAVGIFVLDADFKIVLVNRALEKYFGVPRENLIGKDKRQVIRETIKHIFDKPDMFMNRVFATYTNNTYIENFDCHILPALNREERWLEHWSQPITTGIYAGGRVEHYTDITERTRNAIALAQEQNRLQALVNSIDEIIFEFSADGVYLDISTRNPALLMRPKEEMIGKSIADVLGNEYGKNFQELIDKALETKQTQSIEYSLDLENGKHWFLARVSAIETSPQEPLRVCMIVLEITARKEIEESLAISLRDKEILLKEIHHRVKNNLQVISSLLSLQTRTIVDSNTINILNENAGRVRAMALIHDELYNTENLTQINFRKYITNLTAQLSRAYGINSQQIRILIDTDENTLSIDEIATCGLIVNELVSNSFKYAFPDNRIGTITISLQKNNEREYILSVKDNGVGIPEVLELRSIESLGLQLVRFLARKINGDIQISSHNGMAITITFLQYSEEETE